MLSGTTDRLNERDGTEWIFVNLMEFNKAKSEVLSLGQCNPSFPSQKILKSRLNSVLSNLV